MIAQSFNWGARWRHRCVARRVGFLQNIVLASISQRQSFLRWMTMPEARVGHFSTARILWQGSKRVIQCVLEMYWKLNKNWKCFMSPRIKMLVSA